ncbi:hypothetical protein Tco_0517142 [Tanacetum coccineum]
MNKIASSYEICSGPHDTQYCMKNPEQAFIDYTSSRTNEVGVKQFITNQGLRNFNEATRPPLPKRVHFVKTIIIRKEDEPKKEEIVEPSTTKDNDHDTVVEIKEKVGRELSGSETVIGEGESRDIKQDDPNNRTRGDTKGVDEVDEEIEDTISVIDHYLGGMVLGKPFVKEFGLVYDKDKGTITFLKDKENITFKMPHKMKRFKHIDREILKTDNIPPLIITGDDSDQEKTHYSDSLNLGPAYRRDKSVTKAIQCLIKMKSRKDEGGVT